MKPAAASALGLALVGMLLIGWRIGVLGPVDLPVSDDAWARRASHAAGPGQQLEDAKRLFATGDLAAAATTARELLRREPLQAEALALLARVDAEEDPAAARPLFRRALARAPRNQYVRAWMIGNDLDAGRYPAALANLDVFMRFAPERMQDFAPLIAAMADEDAFARALVTRLAQHPPWRARVLGVLLDSGSHAAVSAVYGGLQEARNLERAEFGAWLQRLMLAELWGEAYSRWVTRLALPPGQPLALLHNGGFESPASGIGFDWRMRGAPGAHVERVRATSGWVARVRFHGRRVAEPNFSQTLLLAPGAYRLTYEASGAALHSDKGLDWALRCFGSGSIAGRSRLPEGDFAWQEMSLDFTVPAENCPAQELYLVNPGADGYGKVVSGTLWFDHFAIQPQRRAGPPPPPSGTRS